MTYEMDIAGLKRDLPLCKVSDDLYIGAFVMFGDVELTVHCAAELLKLTPEYDYLIAPEAKAIPLVYEMARQSGADKYFVARKKAKAYMSSVFQVHVKSITTQGVQTLVLDQMREDARPGAEQAVRIKALVRKVAQLEDLHAAEEDVAQALSEICRANHMTMEELQPYYDDAFAAAVEYSILLAKVTKRIRESAVMDA